MDSLSELRQAAFKSFNQLVDLKIRKSDVHRLKATSLAYYWLSQKMKLEIDYCKIELMNEEQLGRVIAICADHLPAPKNFWAGYAAQKNRRYV